MERAGQLPRITKSLAPRFFISLAFLGLYHAAAEDEWRLTRSPHFEVYSQSSDAAARATVLWFEQLRSLVELHTRLDLNGRPPVRVIAFRSSAEYHPYRLGPSSDAYYVGSESRDYIVMAGMGAATFPVAAHEYAHVVLRAAGADLPLWLREGLAEALASVRITQRGATIGGDLPGRTDTLRRGRWFALGDLLDQSAEGDLGDGSSMFYAESWALADLVLLAPSYAPRFPQFVAALGSGISSQAAFARVYGKSLEAVLTDLQQRNTRRGRIPSPLSGAIPVTVSVESSSVAPLRARLLIAEVVLLTGDLERAESLYRELDRDAPNEPDVALGLGTLALRQGNPDGARAQWKRAIANGASDPVLCFRYASLAGMAGVPSEDIRPVLLRAVELRPDFDDARYSLALLEGNAGHAAEALAQLRAMKQVPAARAFGYWTALANALTELGRRNEAKSAALKAVDVAATEEERRHAAVLAHVAETDLAVRMARDAEGRPRMVTTRIPHDASDFNPFIEPGDVVERVEGQLRDVECGDKVLRITIENTGGLVKLAIRGLDRIQIRHGSGEFVCGPQTGDRVLVEYAKSKSPADGVAGDVRGLEYK